MKINVHKICNLEGHTDCVYSLESGNADNIFYSAAGDGMIVEWDLQNPENGQLIAQVKNSVYAIHFVEEQNLLVAGQNFEGIHILDPIHKSEIGSVKISEAQIFDIKYFSGDTNIG